MLKKIPKILSPDLMKVLMEMGHGDTIVIADGNFPAHSNNETVLRMDGHGVPEILEAILELFPLDTYPESPVTLMAVSEGDNYTPIIWETYSDIVYTKGNGMAIGYAERFEFYKRTKEAYAVVATGETALYANIMLQKGVVL